MGCGSPHEAVSTGTHDHHWFAVTKGGENFPVAFQGIVRSRALGVQTLALGRLRRLPPTPSAHHRPGCRAAGERGGGRVCHCPPRGRRSTGHWRALHNAQLGRGPSCQRPGLQTTPRGRVVSACLVGLSVSPSVRSAGPFPSAGHSVASCVCLRVVLSAPALASRLSTSSRLPCGCPRGFRCGRWGYDG